MKLVLSSFFLFFYFSYCAVLGDVFTKDYTIYTSGIKIGKLVWEVKINNKNYSTHIRLKSGGLLSSIYSFEGSYLSSGSINDNILTPKNYTHNWKTNKINKKMELVFYNNKLKSLRQNPIEKEKLRLNIYEVIDIKDPLSSFLQIIFGADTSLVVDGRRYYTMRANYSKKIEGTIINLTNYSNLWADHKKSSFEKITFETNKYNLLPSKIFIYFDGMIFKLKEN